MFYSFFLSRQQQRTWSAHHLCVSSLWLSEANVDVVVVVGLRPPARLATSNAMCVCLSICHIEFFACHHHKVIGVYFAVELFRPFEPTQLNNLRNTWVVSLSRRLHVCAVSNLSKWNVCACLSMSARCPLRLICSFSLLICLSLPLSLPLRCPKRQESETKLKGSQTCRCICNPFWSVLARRTHTRTHIDTNNNLTFARCLLTTTTTMTMIMPACCCLNPPPPPPSAVCARKLILSFLFLFVFGAQYP